MKSSLFAASSLLAALVWTIALVVDGEPFTPAGVVLIGLGMLLTATVATVGMVVVGGRWAHRLAFTALALTLVLAALRSVDAMWFAGIVATALSVVALLSITVTSKIRKLPGASGPPPRAVLPPLILLVAPAALGFTGNEAASWALLVVGVSAPVAAFLYSRVLPGGLVVIRVVWPLLGIALAPALGWVAGTLASVIALSVAVIAWDGSVKASYHPPQEAGSTFPIPPELAPREILDAARIDEKGKPI